MLKTWRGQLLETWCHIYSYSQCICSRQWALLLNLIGKYYFDHFFPSSLVSPYVLFFSSGCLLLTALPCCYLAFCHYHWLLIRTTMWGLFWVQIHYLIYEMEGEQACSADHGFICINVILKEPEIIWLGFSYEDSNNQFIWPADMFCRKWQ